MAEKRKIVVTGGAGFIGSSVCEYLLKNYDDVDLYIIDNLESSSKKNINHIINHKNVCFYPISVLNELTTNKLIENSYAIFHLAAVVGVKKVLDDIPRCIESNVLGTRNVIQEAVANESKLFFASTSAVYGKDAERKDEESPIVFGSSEIWAYAASKAIMEYELKYLAKKDMIRCVIGRYFNVIGEKQGKHEKGSHVVPTFFRQAMRGEDITVYGNGEQERSFCYVDDAAEATVRMTMECLPEDRGKGKEITVNIGDGQGTVKIKELAEKIKKLTKSESNVIYIDRERAYNKEYEDVEKRSPSLGKLKGYLKDFIPESDIDVMLKRIYDKMKSE